MSDWRGSGVEKCVVCGELYTFNGYYFPTYFQRDETMRGESNLFCRHCLGEPNKFEEARET